MMKKLLPLILAFSFAIPLAAAAQLNTTQGGTGTTSPSGILYGTTGILRLSTVTIGTGLQFVAGVLSAVGSGVTSVFGRTGAVIAQAGDYTTDLVTEATNLYYTNTRVNTFIAASTTIPKTYTANTFSAVQTFTNSPIFSSLGAGAVNSTAGGTLYNTGTSTPTVTSPINYTGTLGSFIGGISGAFTCTNASAGVTGCLTGTDWSTFNGKQAAGNYITALTGDVTASGPGSVAATLATVNGNVGSFTNANITVNAKGLVTAASNGAASGGITTLGPAGQGQTGATQTLATTTNGTDFTITASGDVQSFNLPVASAVNTGKLSSTDWSAFNAKEAVLSFVYPLVRTINSIALAFGTTTSNTWAGTQTFTNSPVFSTLGAGTVNSTAAGTVYNTGTSTPTVTAPIQYSGTLGQFIGGVSGAISITQSGAATDGYLSSIDWNVFNNKISSTSLSGASVISYTSSTGVITTTGGTFGAGNYIFPANLTATGGLSTFSNASSSLFSTGYGSTTNGFIGTLTLPGILNCNTTQALTTNGSGLVACGSISGGAGGAFPFTPTTNFGAVANSTSTAIWFQAGLQASSTINVQNVNIDQFSGLFVNNQLFGYASSTNFSTLFGIGAGGNIATTSAGATTRNSSFGFQALGQLGSTTELNNVGVGYRAGYGVGGPASSNNTAVGGNSLGSTASARLLTQNTAIGATALQLLATTSARNTAVGHAAGLIISASAVLVDNTLLGSFTAGLGGGSLTGSRNTAVGARALGNITSGTNNTFVGFNAGEGVSSGYANITVGAKTQSSVGGITTGFGNVGLANDIQFPSVTGNNQLNIGNLIYGVLPATTSVFQLPTTGSVGIGSSSPFANFVIHANNGDTRRILFAVASSTASATSSLFTVTNSGRASIGVGADGASLATLQLYDQTGTGPSIMLGGNVNGDTDYWVARVSNNDGLDNDKYQIGRDLVPGTSPFFTIDRLGNTGIGTTSPWALLSVASTTWNTFSTPLFSVATSSNIFGQLFSVYATTTEPVASSRSIMSQIAAVGARILVGILDATTHYGYGAPLDQLEVQGRINTPGWFEYRCYPQGLTNISMAADLNNACGDFLWNEDNTATYGADPTAGSTNYAQVFDNVVAGAQANDGAGLFLGSTAFFNAATSTPIIEGSVSFLNSADAPTGAYYIGFTNVGGSSSALETPPTAGCYFTASSTQANWIAVCRAGTTVQVDTGFASTTGTNAATAYFPVFRLEMSSPLADGTGVANFYMGSSTAGLRKVATLTNVTNARLVPSAYMGVISTSAGTRIMYVGFLKVWAKIPWGY